MTRPSPLALALGLLVAIGLWIATGLGISPELMAAHHAYFASHGKDSFLYTTGRLHRLALAGPPTEPQVYITGASGLMWGISRIEHIEAQLAERRGSHTAVHNLLTTDQSILECLSLLDRLPVPFEGVVVIGVNPYRLSRGLASRKPNSSFEYRLGFRSDYLEQVNSGVNQPLSSAFNSFWDNREFFYPRFKYLIRNLFRPAPPVEYRTSLQEAGVRHAPLLRWQSHREQMAPVVSHRFRDRSSISLNAIAGVADAVRSRGSINIVLLEEPMAPRAIEQIYGKEFLASYRQTLQAFAHENHFEYWNLNADARLDDADFCDWTHLNRAEARRRFTELLARRIGESLASAAALR